MTGGFAIKSNEEIQTMKKKKTNPNTTRSLSTTYNFCSRDVCWRFLLENQNLPSTLEAIIANMPANDIVKAAAGSHRIAVMM